MKVARRVTLPGRPGKTTSSSGTEHETVAATFAGLPTGRLNPEVLTRTLTETHRTPWLLNDSRALASALLSASAADRAMDAWRAASRAAASTAAVATVILPPATPRRMTRKMAVMASIASTVALPRSFMTLALVW
ncbi:hypothetical protein GCM10027161_65060 [Microbispora hainanensis]